MKKFIGFIGKPETSRSLWRLTLILDFGLYVFNVTDLAHATLATLLDIGFMMWAEANIAENRFAALEAKANG